RAERRSHLRHQRSEHRIVTRHRIDGRLPHLPAIDQPRAEQEPEDVEVDRPDLLERAQLLEVVQLAIEHEGLGRVRVDEALEGGAQLLLRLEPGSQPARLDETVLVPSPYET